MEATTEIRTRFAPSPTGHLHVGGARTALFCWAYARSRSGRFILRIEDTDRKRSSDAASIGFLEDLHWLGLDWDEGPEYEGSGGGAFGPYFQSERLDIYHRHIQQLLDAGRAYRAFEAPDELAAARQAAQAAGRPYRYDRAALDLDDATVQRYLDEQRPYVVRLRIPDEGDVVVSDLVRGEVCVNVSELDDFVLVKADGYPVYHFAVVVDDEHMQVTHVIRGEEHLKNTIRHVLIQEALGFRRPVYAHLSLIFNPDGSKMSKRERDKLLRRAVRERGLEEPPAAAVSPEHWQWWLADEDHQLETAAATSLATALDVDLPEISVDDFRRAGYLPEVMLNYLALLGWSPGGDVEKFDRRFLLEHFDLDRVIKSPARFDRDKLLAFNLDAIQALTPDEFAERYVEHLRLFHAEFTDRLSEGQLRMLAAANHGRAKTLDDTVRSSRFFIEPDDAIVYETTKPVRKALVNGEPNGFAHLEAIRPRLASVEPWEVESIEACVRSYADDAADGKLGKVAQPLRIAVSGGVVSPAIFETLAILGRASVLNRIDRCLAARGELFGLEPNGAPA
ncbi:MAG: glutamate--tRNA ligase [Planctomycetota bacterium]|jgi:glutamyl-tRNA synthetase